LIVKQQAKLRQAEQQVQQQRAVECQESFAWQRQQQQDFDRARREAQKRQVEVGGG